MLQNEFEKLTGITLFGEYEIANLVYSAEPTTDKKEFCEIWKSALAPQRDFMVKLATEANKQAKKKANYAKEVERKNELIQDMAIELIKMGEDHLAAKATSLNWVVATKMLYNIPLNESQRAIAKEMFKGII